MHGQTYIEFAWNVFGVIGLLLFFVVTLIYIWAPALVFCLPSICTYIVADSLISLIIFKTCNCFLISVFHWFSDLYVPFEGLYRSHLCTFKCPFSKCLGLTTIFQSFFGCVVLFAYFCFGGMFVIYFVVRLFWVGWWLSLLVTVVKRVDHFILQWEAVWRSASGGSANTASIA